MKCSRYEQDAQTTRLNRELLNKNSLTGVYPKFSEETQLENSFWPLNECVLKDLAMSSFDRLWNLRDKAHTLMSNGRNALL